MANHGEKTDTELLIVIFTGLGIAFVLFMAIALGVDLPTWIWRL